LPQKQKQKTNKKRMERGTLMTTILLLLFVYEKCPSSAGETHNIRPWGAVRTFVNSLLTPQARSHPRGWRNVYAAVNYVASGLKSQLYCSSVV
jgi:polyferredoxin